MDDQRCSLAEPIEEAKPKQNGVQTKHKEELIGGYLAKRDAV